MGGWGVGGGRSDVGIEIFDLPFIDAEIRYILQFLIADRIY